MTLQPTLVIMAAGLGSRYGRFKQVDAVGPSGEHLLDYAVFDARRAGFRRLVFVIHEGLAGAFETSMRRMPADLDVRSEVQRVDAFAESAEFARTRTRPWGTVHALVSARPATDAPVVVLNADDFYGEQAYVLARQACDEAMSSGVAAVVGLPLGSTLSDHGPVVRAVCEIRDGQLTRLEEVHGLARTATGIHGHPRRGSVRRFTGDEIVSMNLWVFPPEAVRLLADRFADFVRRHAHETDAELPLPDAVGELVGQGALTVRVQRAPGPWFGLTHPLDRPHVTAALGALVASADYPSPLWNEK